MLNRSPTKLILVDQTSFVSLLPKMGDRSPYIDHWYLEQRLQQLDEFAPLIAAGARAAQLAARAAPVVGRGIAAAGRGIATAASKAAPLAQKAGAAISSAGSKFVSKAAPLAQKAGAAIGSAGSKFTAKAAPIAQRASAAISRAGAKAGQAAGKIGQAAGKVGNEVAKDTAKVGQAVGKVGGEVAKDTAKVAGKAGGASSAAGGGWGDKAVKKLDQFRQSNLGKKIEKKVKDKVTDYGEKKFAEYSKKAQQSSDDEPEKPFSFDAEEEAGDQEIAQMKAGGGAGSDPFKPKDPGDRPLPKANRPGDPPLKSSTQRKLPGDDKPQDTPSSRPEPPPQVAEPKEVKAEPPTASGSPIEPPGDGQGAPQAAAAAPGGRKEGVKQINVGADEKCPTPNTKSSRWGAVDGKRCHPQTPGRKH
jgi:hypothetical protein